MRCFIIAALSADGFIAKNDAHAAVWTSKEDKKRFVELTKKAGVVVMGSKTWKTLGRPLKERVNIVYTTKPEEIEKDAAAVGLITNDSSNGSIIPATGSVETTQLSPAKLLKELEDRGFKEVAICGGSHVYTSFMKAMVVDTLYLTIEPVVFGSGIPLFKEELHYRLELKDVAKTDTGALLLEYKVNFGGF